MKITRVNKIKGHRIFDNFAWPIDLPDFARFNLIYGWNGSGKTTISNLFRYIQRKEPISEGEVEFHIDGKACHGYSLATEANLPQIRVFNREFVEANVFLSMFPMPENEVFVQVQQLNPIFFLEKTALKNKSR